MTAQQVGFAVLLFDVLLLAGLFLGKDIPGLRRIRAPLGIFYFGRLQSKQDRHWPQAK